MLFEQFSNQMHEQYRQLTLAQKMQNIPPFLFIEFIAEQLKCVHSDLIKSWDFYYQNNNSMSWGDVREWSLNHHVLMEKKTWLEALATAEFEQE